MARTANSGYAANDLQLGFYDQRLARRCVSSMFRVTYMSHSEVGSRSRCNGISAIVAAIQVACIMEPVRQAPTGRFFWLQICGKSHSSRGRIFFLFAFRFSKNFCEGWLTRSRSYAKCRDRHMKLWRVFQTAIFMAVFLEKCAESCGSERLSRTVRR